jgi:hypothetical protein
MQAAVSILNSGAISWTGILFCLARPEFCTTILLEFLRLKIMRSAMKGTLVSFCARSCNKISLEFNSFTLQVIYTYCKNYTLHFL